MKNKIKIILTLVFVFVLMQFLFKDSKTPVQLTNNVGSLLYKVPYIAGLMNAKINPVTINQSLSAVVHQTPLVESAKASERRVVYYKGKQLTIYVDNPNKEFTESELEFFYQMELLKDQRELK